MRQLGLQAQPAAGFGQFRHTRALSASPQRQQQQQGVRRIRRQCRSRAQYDANWTSTVDTQVGGAGRTPAACRVQRSCFSWTVACNTAVAMLCVVDI